MTSSPSEQRPQEGHVAQAGQVGPAGQAPNDPMEQPAQDAADPPAAIDAAMVALDGLDTVSVGEHPEAFDRVHIALTDALSAIDGV